MISQDVMKELFSFDSFRQQLKLGPTPPGTVVVFDLSGTPHIDTNENPETLAELVTILVHENTSRLEHLELDHRYRILGTQGVSTLNALFSSVRCPVNLRLDLRFNEIADQQLMNLIEGMSHIQNANIHLDLGHNKISNHGLGALAEFLKIPNCPITALSINDNHGNSNPISWLKMLSASISLNSLVLGTIQCDTALQTLEIARSLTAAVAANPQLVIVDVHFDFPQVTPTSESRNIERDLREELRALDILLAVNNHPELSDTIDARTAVAILSTHHSMFERIVPEQQQILKALTAVINLNWHYYHSNIIAPFEGNAALAHKFVNDVNRILLVKKTNFSISYEALPTPRILLVGLKNVKQLEALTNEKTTLGVLVSNLTTGKVTSIR